MLKIPDLIYVRQRKTIPTSDTLQRCWEEKHGIIKIDPPPESEKKQQKFLPPFPITGQQHTMNGGPMSAKNLQE